LLSILFIHPDNSKPYSPRSLEEGPLGGTEATVIRISEGLAKRGHTVAVSQGFRENIEISENKVFYLPSVLEEVGQNELKFDHVILIDIEKLLPRLSRIFPKARRYLWMHCFPGKRRRKKLHDMIHATNTLLIAVSETHKNVLLENMMSFPSCKIMNRKNLPVTVMYNPIDDCLIKDKTPVDKNKLVFFSSPHKGLWMVLECFIEAKKRMPELTLHIADPGYMKGYQPGDLPDGVYRLGSLPHHKVMQEVRSAFCLFYPQSFFEETFGLVFAEANAVGTPVLAHPHGAASEILKNARQLVDSNNKISVVNRLLSWKVEGRPKVDLHPDFRLKNVLTSWENMCLKAAVPDAQDLPVNIKPR
jgi:glycosyltransferase involved in cell wall biosynthesis